MKIQCIPPNNYRRQYTSRTPGGALSVSWRESKPFFLGPRSVLVHRVRSVQSHFIIGGVTPNHHSFDALCGGACNVKHAELEESVMDDVPASRLLCQRCESEAKRRGLKSAEELTGHHVHVGTIRAHRTCCRETTDNQ